MTVDHRAVLARLGLEAENQGACAGPNAWRGAARASSRATRPTNPRLRPSRPRQAPTSTRCLRAASAAALAWRDVPAPKRGEAVRRLGMLLARAQGRARHARLAGERQDQSRRRRRSPGDDRHRRLRRRARRACSTARRCTRSAQRTGCTSSGIRSAWSGVITAFNFPVAVWAWNALLAAVCGNATIWKPSPKTPLAAIAVQKLCNRIVEELSLPPIFTLLVDAERDAATQLATDPRVGAGIVHRVVSSGSPDRADVSRDASGGAFSNARATTRSSSPRMPISIWSCPRSYSAPSAPRGSAARPRVGSSCTSRSSGEVVRRLKAAYAQVRDRRSAGARHADGTVDRCSRGIELPPRDRGGAGRRGRACLWRRHAVQEPGHFVEPTYRPRRPAMPGRSCSARPSRRSST